MRTFEEVMKDVQRWHGYAQGTLERDVLHYLELYRDIIAEESKFEQELSWDDLHKMFGKYIYYQSDKGDDGYLVLRELRVKTGLTDFCRFVCGKSECLNFDEYKFYGSKK